MIEIRGIQKIFGEKVAVKNLSLSIEKGEVFGFLGPNGAGKTTTMKMILGLLKPTKGTITVFGEKSGSIAARKKIGFLPEMAHFYQHLTGREFLLFIGEVFDIPENEREKRVKKLLKQVHLPSESHDRAIGTYSKGMQQRIGMAQALMNDPEVLFLDEPMSGLDPIGRREMKNIIIDLKKEGKTIFFNSHILSDAETICDRVAIINAGQILLNDTVKNIITKKKTLEDIFIEVITGKTEEKKEEPKKKVKKAVAAKKTVTKKTTVKKAVSKKTAEKKEGKKKTSAKKPAVKKVATKAKAPAKKVVAKKTTTKKTTAKKPGPKKKTIPALSQKTKK